MNQESSSLFTRNELDQIYRADNEYLGEQYKNEKASTAAMCDFVLKAVRSEAKLTVLDGGCGDGAFLRSLAQRLPQSVFTGVDLSANMIQYAEQHVRDPRFRFLCRDLLDIQDLSENGFDLVFLIHTLSMFASFETVVKRYMDTAKGHVFINSLFSTHNVDVMITIFESGYPPSPAWNIFSIRRFTEFALDNGAKNVVFQPFEMPFDLKDPGDGTGSYTLKLADGHRISLTGPVYQPWFLVRIDV